MCNAFVCFKYSFIGFDDKNKRILRYLQNGCSGLDNKSALTYYSDLRLTFAAFNLFVIVLAASPSAKRIFTLQTKMRNRNSFAQGSRFLF